MTAIREQICAILDARLAAIPGVAEYERDPSGDPSDFPAISMTDNGQRIVGGESGITCYALDLTIEVYAEGSSGAAVSAQLNEFHAAVVSAIMQEPPINGLAESFEEGDLVRDTAHLADKPRKGFRQDFTITFPTRRGNPAQQ